jgi:ribosomal protein S18 acetylase RimI-like enzyme
VRSFSVLTPADARAYQSLVFPRYAPLLLSDIGPSGTTVAIGASLLGTPCGLALAGPVAGDVTSLLSVVVAPHVRRRGIATRMIQELEAVLRARGVQRIRGCHRADRPDSRAVSGLLVRSGFRRERSLIELVWRVAHVNQAPVLRATWRGAEVVDFTPERMAPLLELLRDTDLAPASLDSAGADADLSVLIAVNGVVSACVLAQRVTPDMAYFSLLFVRPELRRRSPVAAIAVKRFLERLLDRGIERLSCEISEDNASSLAVADGAVGPYADHRALVHIVGKSLAGDGRETVTC